MIISYTHKGLGKPIDLIQWSGNNTNEIIRILNKVANRTFIESIQDSGLTLLSDYHKGKVLLNIAMNDYIVINGPVFPLVLTEREVSHIFEI